jgi:hypothetical protein
MLKKLKQRMQERDLKNGWHVRQPTPYMNLGKYQQASGSYQSVTGFKQTAAVNVASLNFAPLPPWISFDPDTQDILIHTDLIDQTVPTPGWFRFAFRYSVNDLTRVQEFSVGIYHHQDTELAGGKSYYYDSHTAEYDLVF